MHKYTSLDHNKLLPYCKYAPAPPHPFGWLTGLKAIADHIGCSVQTAANRIKRRQIFAIKVGAHWIGNITWYDETWFWRPASMEKTHGPDEGWQPLGVNTANGHPSFLHCK